MKKRFIHFLSKHSGLYNFAEECYSIFRKVKYKLYGTKSDEKYWAERHLSERKQNDWNNETNDWITSYWNSMDHPHRQFLIEIISHYNPLSILEIGCNCGPNLFLLAKKFPNVVITGIDINPMAVQKGNEWLTKESILNVKLSECKAGELLQFNDKNFDVVFTDAVLIYSGPDKIKKVIEEMLRVSRKALILMEWHDFNSKHNSLGRYKRHWVRDYKTLLKEFVSEDKIKINKLPNNLWTDRNWQKYGAIVEVITNY